MLQSAIDQLLCVFEFVDNTTATIFSGQPNSATTNTTESTSDTTNAMERVIHSISFIRATATESNAECTITGKNGECSSKKSINQLGNTLKNSSKYDLLLWNYRVATIQRLRDSSKHNDNVRSIHQSHQTYGKIHFPKDSPSHQVRLHKTRTDQICLITNRCEWHGNKVYRMQHSIYLVSRRFRKCCD